MMHNAINNMLTFYNVGTSACPNSTFYCNNEGHIGASIRSSYVNDGLCGMQYFVFSILHTLTHVP